MPAQTQHRRTLALVSLASAAWAFCFGLGLPLGSLWLRDAGCSATVIGLCSSAYYLAIAATSLFVPLLMGRRTRLVVVGSMIADGLTVMFFPLTHGLGSWLALRVCGGAATALCLIPMETIINRNAAPATRARDFSIYAVSVALGVAAGSVVGLRLYPMAPGFAFLVGGAAALFGAGLIVPGLPARALSDAEGRQQLNFNLRSNVLSLGTAWSQGFMEAAMLTFMSAYLLSLGYTETVASGLLGGLFIGVVIVQLPGAWLADKVGRLRIVVVCHLVVLTGLVLLPLAHGTLPLAILLFAVGASAAALYPLGLALLGERVPPRAMARANAWYLASNCTGSLMGPWISGRLIDEIGAPGLFIASFVSCALVLMAWLAIGGRTTAVDQSLTAVETGRQAA